MRFNPRYALARLRSDYFLSGIAVGYQKGLPLPPPQYVIWDCTRRCNLACEHCGASKEHYAAELNTAQMRTILAQLAAMGVKSLAVTGGEPLLRRDLLDVLDYARQLGLKSGIATNGFLVDAAMARRLCAVGVHSVQVSLDGLATTHNAIRHHPQSFERAVAALRLLREAGIPLVSVATTVTPHNLADLERLHALLAEEALPLWRLAVAMPIGRAEGGNLLLDGAQLRQLFEFVRRKARRGPRLLIGENLPFLGEWEQRLRREPLLCPIGFGVCCIGVDGYIRGCPEQPDTPENREGSALERPLAEIWQQGFGRYRRREIREQDAACATCTAWSSCYGGCWVMREAGQQCIRQLLA